MNREEMVSIVNELELQKNIELEDIPEIDLYMDQVIQLFESKYGNIKRNDEEKILTKTMINNYAKAKLLMSINKKKYSKEHLILMSLIYNLKGGLSINDIKLSLDNIVETFEKGEEYPLRQLYKKYLSLYERDLNKFNDSVLEKFNEISSNDEINDYEEKFLLLTSMINMSNMYRRMGEKLIDEYFTKKEGKK